MSSVLIEGKNIYKGYRNGLIGRKQIILHDCSIRVYTGETVGICGSSGSGKSTLGRILAGLEMPDHGEVLFEGVNLFHATQNTKKTTRRKIQVLFQDPGGSFNPVRKLEDSMKRVLMLSGVTKPREEIDDVLRKVGLHAEILSRYPHEISGGQAQRLALARILITRPELIILDEPTSGLDVSVQAQILWLLKALKNERTLTYILISHDIDVLSFMSERIFTMQEGSLYMIKNAGRG